MPTQDSGQRAAPSAGPPGRHLGWRRLHRCVPGRLVVGLAACAVLVNGCAPSPGLGHGSEPGTSSSPSASGSGEPVKLGLLVPLSGESRTIGEAMRVASTMAVDHANAAGGVRGRRIELIIANDACDPQTSVLAANSLVRAQIAVSVGGYCSGATLPTLPIFRQAGIPMILPASNSDDLLSPGYDSVFLLSGTGSQEAVSALRWMGRLGVSRVAIVHDGTSYSANIASVAAQRLRSAATLPTADRPPATLRLAALLGLTQGALQHTRATAAIVASKADVVYFTGYAAEAGRLVRDLRKARYRGMVILADGCVDPAMLTFAEGQAEGVYATMVPLAENLALPAGWSQEYRSRANLDPGPFTVQAYDAVTLAVDALRRADPGDGRAIARAIADTHSLPLLTGRASFAADGTWAGFRFNLLQVRSGRFTLVDTDAGAPGKITSGS